MHQKYHRIIFSDESQNSCINLKNSRQYLSKLSAFFKRLQKTGNILATTHGCSPIAIVDIIWLAIDWVGKATCVRKSHHQPSPKEQTEQKGKYYSRSYQSMCNAQGLNQSQDPTFTQMPHSALTKESESSKHYSVRARNSNLLNRISAITPHRCSRIFPNFSNPKPQH